MIEMSVIRDISNRLILLDLTSTDINKNGDNVGLLAKEYISDFDCMDDIIELYSEINGITNVKVKWMEEWDYEHTECDSYFKEIKDGTSRS